MKTKSVVAVLVVAAGLSLSSAIAQIDEHQHQGAAPPQADTAKMGGGMMQMMMQSMMGQNETGALVDKLVKSLAAIETEKDPAALKTKLAEHGALLKELETKVQGQSHMMDMMHQMMGMGGEAKK